MRETSRDLDKKLGVNNNQNNGSIDGSPAAAYRYCVTGDTLVLKPNGSLIRIDELVSNTLPNSDSDTDDEVIGLNNKPVHYSKFFNCGKHPVIEVETELGYSITGSYNHPLLTVNTDEKDTLIITWKLLEDIQESDIVVMNKYNLDEESFNSLTVSDDDLKYIDKVVGMIEQLGYIPERITMGNLKFQFMFLSKLLQQSSSQKVRLQNKPFYSNISVGLLKTLQTMFLNFGIKTKVIEKNSVSTIKVVSLGDHTKLLAIKNNNYSILSEHVPSKYEIIPGLANLIRNKAKYNTDTLERININDAKGFIDNKELIKESLANDELYETLENLINEYKDSFFVKVSKVNYLNDYQNVYSIRVDTEDHAFVANGFINHNTECRLSSFSQQVLTEDLKHDCVERILNFDNQLTEPTSLPAKFPTLLVNGGFGIASGYASTIPPHNINDVQKAIEMIIKDPDVEVKEIIDVLKPDFPTGGIIVNQSALYSAYTKGMGNFLLRSKIEHRTDKKGHELLVITEIPYMTTTERVKENIIKAIKEERVKGIIDIEDLSAKGKIEIIIKIDKMASAATVENQLYKNTILQITSKVILIALDADKKFRIFNIKGLIEEWLNFRRNTLKRIYVKQLSANKKRMHIIEGLLTALEDIDFVISTIRNVKDIESAKTKIRSKFDLTQAQTEAIIEMKLRTLSAMNIDKLTNEYNELDAQNEEKIQLISNSKLLDNVILEETRAITKKFSFERKTELLDLKTNIETEDTIEDKNYLITYTKNGFVKCLEHEFKGQKRGGKGVSIGKVKEGDALKDMFYANSKDHFLAFTNTGKVFDIKVWQLPMVNTLNNNGKPFNSVINLKPGEEVVAVTNLTNEQFENNDSLLIFTTKKGLVKATTLGDFNKTNRSDGLIAIKLREDDGLLDVKYCDDAENTSIFLATAEGLAIRFAATDAPVVSRTTYGNKGIELNETDTLVSMELVDNNVELANIVTVSSDGLGKLVEASEFPVQKRGGKGRMIAKLREGSSVVSANFVQDMELNLIVFSDSKVVSVPITDLPLVKRPTYGNRIINVEYGNVLGITIN